MLYRMAASRPAFTGSTTTALLTAIATHHPPALTHVNPSVPPSLSALIDRLLAKKPEQRPNSATEIADALAAINCGDPVPSPSYSISVPPYDSSDHLFSEGQANNYLNVIIRTEDVGSIRRNGQPISGFSPIGTTGYSGARLEVPAGSLQQLTSTTGRPFAVLAYGFTDYDSYGHMGGTLVKSTGPGIAIESPAEASRFLAGQTILVTGRATTSTPSIPIVRVTVDDQTVEALDAAGHFFTRVTVQPGRNSFRFQATDSLGRVATTFLTLTGEEVMSPNEGLVDVAGFQAQYARTSFDEANDMLYADLAIRNTGVFPLSTPLILTVEDISDPQVALRDFDGRLADGTPYYDLSSLVANGRLLPTELTGIKTLAFHNPGKRRFGYTLILRAGVNRAPVFATVPRLEVVAGKSYGYAAQATDSDGDSLTYTLAAGPTGMSVVSTTGQVSYSPGTGAVGRYSVVLKVEDGKGASALQRYELTVLPTTANRAPIFFTPPIITAAVGTQYVYSPTIRDLDGDAPTVTLTSGPAGASYVNGQLLWTPAPNQVGNHALTLTATDGTLSTSQTFTVRVSPAFGNHAPVITSTALTAVRVGTGYAYRVRAQDEDRDTLSYSISSPTLTGLQVDADGLVSWTAPGTATSGAVTVTVSDGKGGTATQTYTLNVLNVAAATVSGAVFDDLNGDGVQRGGETGQANWTVFADRDGSGRLDPGEWFAVTSATGAYTISGVLPGAYTLRAERLFDKGFTLPSGGSRSVTLSAGQALAGQTFGVKNQANRQPTLSGTPPAAGVAGTLYTFTPMFGDLDGDALRFDLPVNPGGVFVHPVTGALSWTPMADQVGENSVLLRAQDGQGGVALLSFSVNIAPANHRPFITSLPQLGPVELGMTYRYQITALDPDAGDTLTYTKLNPTPAGVVVNPTTGVVTWNPQAGGTATGTYTISVRVADAAGLTAVQAYQIVVGGTYTDRPPVIVSHPRTVTGVGQTYLYPVRGVDPDGNPVTISLVDPPAGMQLSADNVLSWTPTAPGQYTIKVKVSDGKYHITQGNPNDEYRHIQVFTLTVLPEAPENRAPVIVSTPPLVADIDSVLSYNVLAGDLDDDFMRYTLRGSVPDGVVLDPVTGALRWRPAAWQGGYQTISVRALDRFGAFTDHTFTVLVRDGNRPPLITSTPPSEVEVNQPYSYPIRVEDADGDAITLSWSGSIPPGLQLVNGAVKGTPTTAGTYNFTIRADDARGAFSEQLVRLVVSPVLNWPPVIDSGPVLNTATGGSHSYQIVVRDPDNDALSYSVTTTPSVSMTVNSTGQVSWSVPGNFVASGATATVQVTVRATDNGTPSRFAEQTYTLTVRGNRALSLAAISTQSVTAGNPWKLDLAGSDPDTGDALTYALTGRNGTVVPPSLTVDSLGRVRWDGTAIGTYEFTATVTDPYGLSASRDFTLTVLADTQAPTVMLEVQDDPGKINVRNRFRVDASDNVGVVERKLEVSADGGTTWQVIGLNNDGVGSWTPTAVLVYQLRATAKDAAGLTGTVTRTLSVIDPTATQPPVVHLTGPSNNGQVTQVTAVTGTVTDNGALLSWKLEYRPADASTDWKTIRSVTSGLGSSVNVNEAFDPTLLPNGLYQLRLTGTDTGGNVGTDQITVHVDGHLKLGNFTLDVTDVTIPVAGIPITIGRHYDTLDANKVGDFGYGWRLTLGGYSVTVDRSTTNLPFINSSPTFKDGTRVYVKRPDGGLDGYTFTPVPAGQFFGSVLNWYPAFTPDPGVINALKVDQVVLTKNEITGEYYDYELGGYNPIEFGNAYDVVAPTGITNEIDARTGEQIGVRDRNDNKLTFEENAIVSNRGVQVTIERAQGRIIAVEDPRGNKVRYRYDTKGNLIEVTDRTGVNTATYGYLTNPAHYPNTVTDATGAQQLAATFDPVTHRLAQVSGPGGSTASYGYTMANPTTAGAERATATVTVPNAGSDGSTGVTTVASDARGNPVRTVDQAGNTALIAYGAPNLPDAPTQTVQVVGQVDTPQNGETNDVITTIRYDNKTGRPVASTDSHTSGTSAAAQAVTRTYYNSLGLPTAVSDPLGNTAYQGYDERGNLTSTRSVEGVSASLTHDARGNLTTVTQAGLTAAIGYDALGRISRVTNSNGTVTTYSHDANGNATGTSRVWTNPANPADQRTLTTSATYDANDRAIASTDVLGNTSQTRYDQFGRAYQTVDPHGNVTTSVFDADGQVIEVDNPDGTITRTVYDTQGRVTYETDPFVPGQANVRGTHTAYDTFGRVVADQRLDGLVITVTVDGTGTGTAAVGSAGTVLSESVTKYNALGQEYWAKDASGVETTTLFDSGGRPIQMTEVVPATTNSPAATLVISIQYDAAGRPVITTDELGQSTRTTYDGDGNPTVVTYANGSTTQIGYDANGRKAFTIDQVGQKTAYGYDALGRLVTVTQPTVTDPTTGQSVHPVTTYGYDAYGHQTSITDANGHATAFAFDQFGRQTSRTLPAVNGTSAAETTTYDAFGNLATSTDFVGNTTKYVYDYDVAGSTKLGRVVEIDYTQVGASTPQTVVQYGYDALGRQNKVVETTGGGPGRRTPRTTWTDT